MKKSYIGLFLLALANTTTGYAQEKELGNRIFTEFGLSTLWNPHTNLSPFGLKYQSKYFGITPAIHTQLLYAYQTGQAIGLEYQGGQRRASLEELSAETRLRQNYFALAWANAFPVSQRGIFFRQSVSVGATYTDALAQAWGTRAETKAHAWGVGANYRLTLSYRLSKYWALGIQLGIGAYSSFRWQGAASPDAYTGGLFGKDTNSGFYPSLGIVLTNPLGR